MKGAEAVDLTVYDHIVYKAAWLGYLPWSEIIAIKFIEYQIKGDRVLVDPHNWVKPEKKSSFRTDIWLISEDESLLGQVQVFIK